jgi:hypothetical protein
LYADLISPRISFATHPPYFGIPFDNLFCSFGGKTLNRAKGEKPFKKKTEQVTNENCNHNHHVCIFSHDACSFPLGNAVIPLFRFLLSKNRDYMLLHIMICQVVLIEHHQLMGAGG